MTLLMPRTGFIGQLNRVFVEVSSAPDQPVALKLRISPPWLPFEPAAQRGSEAC